MAATLDFFFFQALTSWPFRKYKIFLYRQWYIKLCGCFLTVDGECDLSLSYSNPWDDGLTYILAGIRLAHRLQIQLVAVTQNLWGREKGRKYKQGKSAKQQEGINKIKAHMYMSRRQANVLLYLHLCTLLF